MNIIFVAGVNAPTRSMTVDWRHWTAAAALLMTLLVLFTLLFNYVTLRYAASMKLPLLQSIMLADQREEAQRSQRMVQGHLSAMAMKMGELQAQILRLDGLGERLAKLAGLKPQELPTAAGIAQGGPAPSLAKNISVDEFSLMLNRMSKQIEQRSDQLSVLEGLLVTNAANKKFLPTLMPIEDGWFSSNFGWRVDPFSGEKSFHEGIDFPAESGTSILASASGKVVTAEVHPQYGRLLEIDHGNGLISRYAHTSALLVREGDLVVRGQPVATVGSTGRSTGPHLHFEVRLNGVPQNPARFLQTDG